MSVNRRVIRATPERVWSVLSDGYSYARWVVGVKEIRSVDQDWPSKGARIHHTLGGAGSAATDKDETVALSSVKAERLQLRAYARPLGAALITIDLRPHTHGTEVTLTEDADSGPGRLIPRPLRNALLRPRNYEALERLAELVEVH